MGITVIAPPDEADILAILPVAKLKESMRVTHTVEDDYFRDCILEAYDWLCNPEVGWLNRTLITTTYKMTLPGLVQQQVYTSRVSGGPERLYTPSTILRIPKPPLISVQSVKYLLDGVLTTLATTEYVVVKDGLFGYIARADGVTWPTTIDAHPGAVEIAFTAGYGDGEAVKEKCRGIVRAMKLLAGDAYRNREDTYAEPRLVAVNRKIINGVTRYAGRYRIMNAHA